MKNILAIQLFCLSLLFLLSGCVTSNLTTLESALAKDDATVFLSVTTLYGSGKLVRIGGLPANTIETVAPDGTVTIKSQ